MNKIDKFTGSVEYLIDIANKYNAKVVSIKNNFIHVIRNDGFSVFLDRYDDHNSEKEILNKLNIVRLSAGKHDVIMAVSLYRARNIAKNYANKHNVAIEECSSYTELDKSFAKRIGAI